MEGDGSVRRRRYSGNRLVDAKAYIFRYLLYLFLAYFTSISTLPVTESASFHFCPHSRPSESKIFINPGAGFFLRAFGGLTFGLDRAIGFKPPRDPNGGVSSCRWDFVTGFLSANASFSKFVVSSSAVLFGVFFGCDGIMMLSNRRITFFITAPALSSSNIFNRLNRMLRSLFLGNIPDTARRKISPVPYH